MGILIILKIKKVNEANCQFYQCHIQVMLVLKTKKKKQSTCIICNRLYCINFYRLKNFFSRVLLIYTLIGFQLNEVYQYTMKNTILNLSTKLQQKTHTVSTILICSTTRYIIEVLNSIYLMDKQLKRGVYFKKQSVYLIYMQNCFQTFDLHVSCVYYMNFVVFLIVQGHSYQNVWVICTLGNKFNPNFLSLYIRFNQSKSCKMTYFYIEKMFCVKFRNTIQSFEQYLYLKKKNFLV